MIAVGTPSEHNDSSSYIEVISSSSVQYSQAEQKKNERRKRSHTGLDDISSKKAKLGEDKSEKPVTLLEVLSMGRAAMEVVIDDWIEAYMLDRDSCLLDLIGFFIQCCGCKGVITAEMCEHEEESQVKKKLVEKYDEDSGLQYKKVLAFPWILTVTWPTDVVNAEYPLIQPGPCGRWFHADLCEFVSVFVARCQKNLMFDGFLMNALLSLLSELSNSFILAFRHTCTLAAVKVQSSLIAVAEGLQAAIKNAEKQRKRRKLKRRRSSPPLRSVHEKITRLQENKAEVEAMMDVVFKGVFLKRYRDIHPEIRCICMEEFGVWLKTFPSVFLNDSYLKYLGWALYDKAAEVRLKVVAALQRLCEDPKVLPELDLFSSRFKSRIISMTLDKDHDVSVQTVKLLVFVSKSSEDFLTQVEYKKILKCVYASHRPLAAAAGELLLSWLLKTVDVDTNRLNKAEAQRRRVQSRLKALIQFHINTKLHTHVVYLVDSLWDCAGPLLKDWSAITSLLLGPGLSQKQKVVLAEILLASVHQTSERRTPPGRSGSRKAMTVKEKRVQLNDCKTLTEHFLQVLPHLLSKFSSCSSILASLMSVPRFLQDDADSRLVLKVMSAMEDVLKVRSDPGVLEAAARSFLRLSETWSSEAGAARDSLVQGWVDRLTRLMVDSLQGDGFSASKATTSGILICLKRLRAFLSCHDLSRWDLFELLFPLLPAEGALQPPTEILLEAMQCLCFSLVWSLSRSEETLTLQDEHLSLFCARCLLCLAHSEPRVQEQSFLCLCDALAARSSRQLRPDSPSTSRPLTPYQPSPELQVALLDFTRSNIFVDSEPDRETPRGEEVRDRRRQLVALCRLLVDGLMEAQVSAQILAFYGKFHSDFGDIIKETIVRTRRSDQTRSVHMVALCLQQMFVKQLDSTDPRIQTFNSIRELSRRFALLFSDDDSLLVASMLRLGLDFAVKEAPQNLDFLNILLEFSSKLSPEEKKNTLSYLQQLLTKSSDDHHTWIPVKIYMKSLETQDQERQDQEPQDQERQDQERQDQEPQDQEPQDQEPQDQEPQDQERQDQERQDQEPQEPAGTTRWTASQEK